MSKRDKKQEQRRAPDASTSTPGAKRPSASLGVERLLPAQPGGRAEGALGRLRPRHPSRLRQRSSPRGGATSARPGWPSTRRGHEDPLRRHSPRSHVRVDDHERRGAADHGAYIVAAEEQGVPPRSSPGPSRTTSSRSSWSATPTSTRPSPRMRIVADIIEYSARTCRASTRSRSPATTCRRPVRRRSRSWPSPWPTAWTTCAPRIARALDVDSSRRGSRSSGRSA